MTSAIRSRLAWVLGVGAVAIILGVAADSVASGGIGGDDLLLVTVVVAMIAWALVGATIASRTGNAVGWALLAVIVTLALALGTETYATYSLTRAARPLPLTVFAAWVGTITFFLALALIVSIPLLYPTGVPRWRWVWRLYVGAVTVLIGGFAIYPQELSLMDNNATGPPNPYAIDAWRGGLSGILAIAGFLILFCAALSVASLIARYRSSHGDERQQVRWLAYVGIATVFGFILNAANPHQNNPAPGLQTIVSTALFLILLWIVVLGIPTACGIAILKYHLYDLDVVIRKTVVFTVVAATLTGSYLAVLALATVGRVSRVVVGAVLLAVTVRPVQRAAHGLADRVVYGKRASAYEVLTEFSGHMGETYATEDVLPRMAQVLASGTGASSVKILLRVGAELREAAAVGDASAREVNVSTVPVVDRGEELGAFAVTMPANDPMNPAKEKLVRDLASQAGLVLRNVRLIEELRSSRQRLVAAQDEERRKIERNIHDGAQQQLVALAVKLRLTKALVTNDPVAAERTLDELQAETTTALEDLRDLARGIYPPLLADQGLPAALGAQSRKSSTPVTVDAEGIGRFTRDVEAAVYFCVLEALNNVAKYAGATRATVRLTNGAGQLRFEVEDDGTGFDPLSTGYGTGLQGMADRLDAIGGALSVTSSPGAGTTIGGLLPTEATSGDIR